MTPTASAFCSDKREFGPCHKVAFIGQLDLRPANRDLRITATLPFSECLCHLAQPQELIYVRSLAFPPFKGCHQGCPIFVRTSDPRPPELLLIFSSSASVCGQLGLNSARNSRHVVSQLCFTIQSARPCVIPVLVILWLELWH